MNNFYDIFEKATEDVDPEYALAEKLEAEIKSDVEALEAEYWFDDEVFYNVDKVMKWLREHHPELYKRALADPAVIEGKDELSDALKALGYMKEWTNMEEDELESPEDIERWRIATGYYGEEE
jgi:hypothetical protein